MRILAIKSLKITHCRQFFGSYRLSTAILVVAAVSASAMWIDTTRRAAAADREPAPRTITAVAIDSKRIGRSTDRPLPRFASVKAGKANLRRGPGLDYPILWELTRRGLPVRIIAEYGHWRRVVLHDGVRGWIHKDLLSGARTAIVLDAGRALYAEPADAARLVATLAPVTPVRLTQCDVDWCEAERKGVRGWIPRRNLWGLDSPATP